MQDPQSNTYTYTPDQMGRKSYVTYPLDSYGVNRVEHFTYDTAGRLYTSQNRTGWTETFTYDALNRLTLSHWNDNTTPNVSFSYDDLCRLTTVTNSNATISRYYFNDNLLSSETSTYADNRARTITYIYDADANRATSQYPANAYSFTYNYTGRNQLQSIVDNTSATIATYWYDVNSNLIQRNPGNGTTSSYGYDALNRVVNITHLLNTGSRRLEYGYDNVSNRLWTWRDNGNGDTFRYDLDDQVVGVALDVPNPNSTPPPAQTIAYDANGNRVTFAPYGTTDTYSTNGNNLNQYSTRNLTQQAAYNANGDMTTGFDGSTYTYDAQNRLLSATKNGTTETFAYDGLNRQVSRTIVGGSTTYNVYDGWDLIGEYAPNATVPTAAYLSGAGGLIKNLVTNNYYYQDASGSTSHLADSTGHLIEWYRYDLQGTPIFYNGSNSQIPNSNYGIRHLFTGQQWYSELGLYDLRNRYYSPDIGRFLQPDPSGFAGDATNLYRYCGNNPLTGSDPMGTDVGFISNGAHNWVGVTNPTGSMTYFDFSPAHPNLFTVLTLALAWPGEWNTQDDRPQGAQYETISTTSAEDARVLEALNNRVQNQGDWYSSLLNDCYTAPMDLVDEVLSSNTDDPSEGDLSLDFISLIPASSVATPIGAFDVNGDGGSFFTESGGPGFDVLPGGSISAPGGGTVAGYTGSHVGPLSPVNYNWFFSTLGWLGKPIPYHQYVASFPRGYGGSDIGGRGSQLMGVKAQ